jgi:hypothetical protein
VEDVGDVANMGCSRWTLQVLLLADLVEAALTHDCSLGRRKEHLLGSIASPGARDASRVEGALGARAYRRLADPDDVGVSRTQRWLSPVGPGTSLTSTYG